MSAPITEAVAGKCPNCDGTGELHGSYGCRACGGTGIVVMRTATSPAVDISEAAIDRLATSTDDDLIWQTVRALRSALTASEKRVQELVDQVDDLKEQAREDDIRFRKAMDRESDAAYDKGYRDGWEECLHD